MSRIARILDGILARLLPTPPHIRPDEDVVFVDVRTRHEFDQGHVRGAHHIPFDQMDTRWKELRPHRKQRVLLYCRSGRRSRIATDVIRARGFDRAENAGGLGALKRAGVEVER
jgi:rhodanese-related sulfurtransferase